MDDSCTQERAAWATSTARSGVRRDGGLPAHGMRDGSHGVTIGDVA